MQHTPRVLNLLLFTYPFFSPCYLSFCHLIIQSTCISSIYHQVIVSRICSQVPLPASPLAEAGGSTVRGVHAAISTNVPISDPQPTLASAFACSKCRVQSMW